LSRKATGELKNVRAGAYQVFLRGVPFRHQGGRDRRQSASAASESVLGPEIPVFYGMSLPRSHPRPCHRAVWSFACL